MSNSSLRLPFLTALSTICLIGCVAQPTLPDLRAVQPRAVMESSASVTVRPPTSVFIPAIDQADPADLATQGRFRASFADASVTFGPHGVVFQQSSTQPEIHLRYLAANPHPILQPRDPHQLRMTFALGNDPSTWRMDVPTYGELKYGALYPGIDAVFNADESGNLKSTYYIAGHVDPRLLRWRYDGAARVAVDGVSGALNVFGGDDTLLFSEQAPRAWQELNGQRHPVTVQFQVDGDVVGFVVGAYQIDQPLIIDPTLQFSRLYTGSGDEEGHGVAIKSSGDIYLVGSTNSSPMSTDGTYNAFIYAYTADGTPKKGVIIGGNGEDRGRDVALDNSGNVWITGRTTSTNFPTVNAWRSNNGGGTDAFAVKYNGDLNTLSVSTYVGGSGYDGAYSLDVDDIGNAIIVGYTESTNFPTVSTIVPPFQPALAGTRDAFIVDIPSTGGVANTSTYFGGTGVDEAYGIRIDKDGKILLSGITTSTDLPTSNAMQSSSGGDSDAFVAKFNPTADLLHYSTYIGGSAGDASYGGLAVDASGNAYVAGRTFSPNFAVVNGIQGTYGGAMDGFLVKLNASGQRVYSTFLGGSADEEFEDIWADAETVVLVGSTVSTNYPTSSPVQANNAGSRDIVITKLNQGVSLSYAYSTYLGGSGADSSQAVIQASDGTVYAAGDTQSSNFPSASGYVGGKEAVLFMIKDGMTPSPTYSVTGRVATAQNLPVANVTISDGAGRSTTTNQFGNYMLSGLPAGTYIITPSAGRYNFTPQSRSISLPSSVLGSVDFIATEGLSSSKVHLPLTQRDYVSLFTGTFEVEPNNSTGEANGALRSGVAISGYPNDQKDYFSFYLSSSARVRIELTNHTGGNVQLQLFYQSINNRIGDPIFIPPYTMETGNLSPGWYYIYINTGSAYTTTTPYSLVVSIR
jgi:hypothetical protein